MQTRITIHRDFTVAQIDPRIYGAHLGTPGDSDHSAVVDAAHPAADEAGLRTDVLDLARAFRLPCIMGPGLDRPVGADLRPVTGDIRVDGLVDWCRRTGAEPMLALAASDATVRRRALGIGERHGVRMWHLGAADDAGRDESFDSVAAAVRARHPGSTLVLGATEPAVGMLRRVREAPDLVSLGEPAPIEGLPASVRLDRAISAMADRLTRTGVRAPGGQAIGIQVDRWGCAAGRPAAEAALDRALALNVMIRRADRVRTAFASEVLSGLAGYLEARIGMGHAPGLYDPILAGSVYGRGHALMPAVRGPVVETADGEALPVADCAAVRDDETGTLTLFLANRGASAAALDVDLHGFPVLTVAEHRLAAPGLRLPGLMSAAPALERGRIAWGMPGRSYGLVRLARLAS